MRSHFARAWPLVTLLLTSASTWAVDHHVIVGGGSGGYYNNPVLMFNPSSLTITAGDTVTFSNAGGTHNATADDGSFRCSRGCDGDGNGGNGNPSATDWSATVAFNHAGVFTYHCEVHGSLGMTGTITVLGGSPPSVNMDQQGLSGSWANAATDSQGVLMTVYPDLYGAGLGLLFGGWFTYDVTAPGGQRWYTIQGQVSATGTAATMPVYLTEGGEFDSSQATTTAPVGQATVRFSDCTHGSLDYSFSDGSGRTGTIPLARLLQNVTCSTSAGNGAAAGPYLLSGAWADLGNSGQGLVFDVNPPQNVLFAAWYTFNHDATPNAGPGGQHWYTLQSALTPGSNMLNGIGIFDTSGGVFDHAAATTTVPVGSADLVFHDCASATLTYDFTAGANAGRSGTLDLSRIGPAPPGCSL